MATIDENQLIKQKFHRQKYLNYYLSGIIDTNGTFGILIKQENSTKFGWAIDPEFKVIQEKKDVEILNLLKRTLSCGKIQQNLKQKNILEFVVQNRRSLVEKVVPFFKRYQLIIKEKNFEHFVKVLEMLNSKKHSEKNGIIEIIKYLFEKDISNSKYSLEFILNNLK